MNIHILTEASHSLAKDRGFWKTDKDLREELLYVISNVGDIAKAFKKNRKARWDLYDVDSKYSSDTSSKIAFKRHIKDSFEDEIANVILRITDLFGGKKINITESHPWLKDVEDTDLNYFFRNVKTTEEFDGNVAYWLNEALALCLFSSDKDQDFGLSHILFHLGSLIEFFDIDIEKQLTKKIEYNRSRPLLYISDDEQS